ncbi:hypothetical protein OJ998_00820 [Solirubrobacter taibaiensis]|nr:hypothetical protein [Solirubrobacter taibaiensis]
MSVDVRLVGDRRPAIHDWVKVPFALHRDDPCWVPPLRGEARRALDRRRNPFFRHADVEHFVAYDDSDIAVGRIAATIYPAHHARFGDMTGFFGFFEAVDDPAVARALLTTAEDWLAERGMRRVAGPYNYCSTQEMGLLVDGFDAAPTIFQTYNPPRYVGALQTNGYAPAFSMSTYHFRVSKAGEQTRVAIKAGDAALAAEALRVRRLDRRRYADEMETLRRLFNTAFADNHDVLPYEHDVFHAMVRPLKPFVDPRLIAFVERDGEPVAFTVMVPDLNALLHQLGGRLTPWSAITLKRRLRRIDSAVILLIGALPQARHTGIGRALVGEIIRGIGEGGYEHVHTTWVHEHNAPVFSLVAQFDADVVRRYAIYDRTL